MYRSVFSSLRKGGIFITPEIDEIILNFTPEQYLKYLSVTEDAKIGKVDFDFGISDTLPPFPSYESLENILHTLEETAKALLAQHDIKRSFFSFSSLTEQEIQKLMTVYYKAVLEINALSEKINLFVLDLFKAKEQIERAYCEKIKAYQNFLPYKAALYENSDHKQKIAELDASLLTKAQDALNLLKKAEKVLEIAENVSEKIIPDFFAKSGLAAGSPPYDTFSENDFFASINGFIEQIKSEAARLSE